MEDTTASGDKATILIVDDTPDNIAALSALLRGQYRTKAATSGARALTLAAESPPPDLILLDVMMPSLDGGTLASQLQISTKLKGVPIVFLTAAVTREEVRARRGLVGGLPFLAKPVDLHEVLACLKRHLGAPQASAPTP